MNPRYATFASGLAAGIVLTFVVLGLRDSEQHAASALAAPRTLAADERRVKLGQELAKRAKIETKPIRRQALSPTLQLVGSVNFDANQLADVGARLEGRVARMLVTTGDVVERGQPLVEIESSALGEVLSDLLGARANLIAAQHSEKREEVLYAQQLASAAVIERARAEVKALSARVHGSERRLLTMGLTREEIAELSAGNGSGRITLRSPLAGEVVSRYAVLGQVVDPTEPILRVANLDSLWVELDVFEHDLSQVADGNHVEIEAESYPGRKFAGKVTHVDATIDIATRTARVRVEVDNLERRLRPGQFVTARLTSDGTDRLVLTVPRKAILQVDGVPAVFVATKGREYVARPVELGPSAGDSVEVTRGLVEGDNIVTAGAFVLKSELLR